MKNLVVHLSKMSDSTTIASIRIAKTLARILECPIADSTMAIWPFYFGGPEARFPDVENVIIVNSPSAFCEFLDELVAVCHRAKRIIWVMNDYNIYPPTQLRKYLYENNRKLELWSTLPELPEKFEGLKTYGNLPRFASHVLNWNALTFEPTSRMKPSEDGIVYWGAFRQDRIHDFDKYFHEPPYKVTLSTTKRVMSKFQFAYGASPNVHVREPFFQLISEIRQWAATVYIEDKFSHNIFCQPANRFYEALSAGIAIFVDINAKATLEKAGFTDIDEDMGLVDGAVHLDSNFKFANTFMKRQQEEWVERAIDYRRALIEELSGVLGKEGILP